jgi:DNA modification methylase
MTQGGHHPENAISDDVIKKWRRDIVPFSPVIKINSKGENTLGHSAPFPKDIPEMAVRFFSYPGDNVLDMFAGSFTTAIVANKLNRVGIGIELNKEMFRDAILKRIEQETFSLLERQVDELDLDDITRKVLQTFLQKTPSAFLIGHG